MTPEIINNPTEVKPLDSTSIEETPVVKPKLFSPLVVVLILLLTIATVSAGYFYSQTPKEDKNSNAQKVEITPTEILSDTVAPTYAPVVSATIKGQLSYPSEFIPPMSVCAVSSSTDVETCVETELNQNNFEIEVNPGTYVVYSNVELEETGKDYKAYYTKCDTYEDSFIPECNPNAGPEEYNGKWNKAGFICYEDAICKAAYTPLKISVADSEVKQLKTIIQGWYIPCSHDTATCNDVDFDVWSDYSE